MNKERMAAFTDAVLAIVMTILVLELEKPKSMTLAGLWDLRANFFAYALSFFWLGLMWLTHHNNWEKITKVNNQAAIFTLLMLFFSSLFPYTTGLVAANFNNAVAQSFYGVVVLAVTLSNIGLSRAVNKANDDVELGLLYTLPNRMTILDIAIKLLGLVLAITVYPPAMIYSIFLSMFIIGFAHL